MQKKNSPVFLIPHWTKNIDDSKYQLEETIGSIEKQSDPEWSIIIVDDKSPCANAKQYLDDLESRNNKIRVIHRATNGGPGASRNTGIEYAAEMHAPFILYNDADDLSHPDRLKYTRAIFERELDVDVVYSTFKVIDEYGAPFPPNELTGSIAEILEGHEKAPLQGMDIWIDIGIDRGYTNLTSSTSVRTGLAKKYAFPEENVSEDSYTWMTYSAGGNRYKYCPSIPSLYRIPRNGGSYSRIRVDAYYQTKATIDELGFVDSLRIAAEKNPYFQTKEVQDDLMVRFYVKLGETLFRENELSLSREQIDKATNISQSLTSQYLGTSSEAFNKSLIDLVH